MFDEFALVPDVIPRGDYVGAGFDHLLHGVDGQADSGCEVFALQGDEIDIQFGFQIV